VDAGVLTARELVALGRYPYTDWLGRLGHSDRERVAAAIEAVDASALAERAVRSLSDGERQRVLIARALAQEPRLMILDEPTAYLDLPRRIETMGLLRRLSRETGVAVLLSTHHLDLALGYADAIWLLPLGGALEVGAPEDLALSGAIERAFVSEHLVFDADDGSFHLREEPDGPRIAVAGDGLARIWAERALRRRGFVPVQERAGAPPPGARVVVLPVEPPRFELEVAGERVVCASLRELLQRLGERAPAPRQPPDSRRATSP
jgi:iron complex transport system ATP-binding protein